MLEQLSRSILGITTILVSIAMAGVRASAADPRIAQEKSAVSIYDGSRLVLHYRYTDVPKKPYADQLVSPAGVQVLRDSPADHKHHHGLMYAFMVDGINFWEEHNANSGRELHKSFSNVKATVHNAAGRAGFVEEIDWVGAASDKPLLIERRAIDVLQVADLGATLIKWHCRFQTPPGKDSAVITGNHYHGLGMRFPVSMDTGGRFFNADDSPGENVNGQRLTSTKWCAYTAKADGKPVTVAIFDHPANLRHPAKMFTMNQPFAYLSATMNEWKEPITVKADKPLDLCYGVAVWDGEVDKATVEKVYRQWLALVEGEAGK